MIQQAKINSEIPAVPGLPFFGHTLLVRRDLPGRLNEWRRTYGSAYYLRFPGIRLVMLTGPDALGFVLRDAENNFSSRLGWSFFLDRIFPGAILAMDGAEHRYQRRIMQTAFTRESLIDYQKRMAHAIEVTLAKWGEEAGASRLPRFYPRVKHLTLGIAASSFMGVELSSRADRLNRALVDMVEASLAWVRVSVPGLKLHRGLRGRRLLVEEFRALLPEKRERHSPDLFSGLCHAVSEDGEKFSDEEIINHIIFLMMAAHDTSTSALSTLTYLLARHQDWQERLREESRALGKDYPDYEDLDKLRGLTLAMKESLRLYPPLASMPRVAVRDCEFEGRRIPGNTFVSVAPMQVHYMDEIWTRPREFDPERFSEGRREDQAHRFAYAPFGGGGHPCIGKNFAGVEIRMVMHRLLLKYRWSVPEGYEMPVKVVPIIMPADGLPLRLEAL